MQTIPPKLARALVGVLDALEPLELRERVRVLSAARALVTFAVPAWPSPRVVLEQAAVTPRRRPRKNTQRCGICHQPGHNAKGHHNFEPAAAPA